MTRLLKTVTRAQTLLKMQKFPLTGKVLKLQIFPPAGNSGPSEQQNGGGIVMIPPPRSLRRAYAVSCKETKNPNPLPTANRFGFLDFGTPDWIRTSDLQSRSLTLYPTELRAHIHLQGKLLLRGNSSQIVVNGGDFFSLSSRDPNDHKALRRLSTGPA